MVRAGKLELPWACDQRIFVPATAFAAVENDVCDLEYPFTLLGTGARCLGASRLDSTASPPLRSVPEYFENAKIPCCICMINEGPLVLTQLVVIEFGPGFGDKGYVFFKRYGNTYCVR